MIEKLKEQLMRLGKKWRSYIWEIENAWMDLKLTDKWMSYEYLGWTRVDYWWYERRRPNKPIKKQKKFDKVKCTTWG